MLPDTPSCLIIGAGMAGLSAGSRLQAAGWQVLLLDKGRSVGGRMATRRIASGVFDHGAQFFTARSPEFQAQVDEWLVLGLAKPWTSSFNHPASSPFAVPRPVDSSEGHTRYCAAGGMTSIAKHLAATLPVRVNARVLSLSQGDGGWQASTEDGSRFSANAMILTAPVPQALELVASSQLDLYEDSLAQLSAVQYDPCLAVLALVEGETKLPEHGGLPSPTPSLGWIADNHRKGISPQPGAITLHASADFSRRRWHSDDQAIIEALWDSAMPWVNSSVLLQAQVKRWRYSRTVNPLAQSFAALVAGPPLLLAGDGFSASRIEAAYLSGRAAADHLLAAI